MKKTLVIGALGMAMSLALCGSAFAEEVTYEADVNGDGKVVVGYISKNFTDPFHAPINARAEDYFDQATSRSTVLLTVSRNSAISLFSFLLRQRLPIRLWYR